MPPTIPPPNSGPSISPRIGRALLIGVTNYGSRKHRDGTREYRDLKKGNVELPREDIKTVGSFLEKHGFEVEVENDLESKQIIFQIREFAKRVKAEDIVWIYLAGHADYFMIPDKSTQRVYNHYGFIGLDCQEVYIFTILESIWPDETKRPTLIVTLDTCFRFNTGVNVRSGTITPLSSPPPNVVNPIDNKLSPEDSQEATLTPFLSEWKHAIVIFNRKANSDLGLTSDFSNDLVKRLQDFTKQITELDINGKASIGSLVEILKKKKDLYGVIRPEKPTDFDDLKTKSAFSYDAIRIIKELLESGDSTLQQKIKEFITRIIEAKNHPESLEELRLIQRVCGIHDSDCAQVWKLIEKFEEERKDIEKGVTKERSEEFQKDLSRILDRQSNKDDARRLTYRYTFITDYYILKECLDTYNTPIPGKQKENALQLIEKVKHLGGFLQKESLLKPEDLKGLPIGSSICNDFAILLGNIISKLRPVDFSKNQKDELFGYIEKLYEILGEYEHQEFIKVLHEFTNQSYSQGVTDAREEVLPPQPPLTRWSMWAVGGLLLLILFAVVFAIIRSSSSPPPVAQQPTGVQVQSSPQMPINPPATEIATLPPPTNTPPVPTVAPTVSPTAVTIPTQEPSFTATIPSPPHDVFIRMRIAIREGMVFRLKPLSESFVAKLREGTEIHYTGWTRIGGQRWFRVSVPPNFDQDYWMASEAGGEDGLGVKPSLEPLEQVEGKRVDLFDVRYVVAPPQ
ncbi:MAG: caspase family protein [Chloroflexales bacterium]